MGLEQFMKFKQCEQTLKLFEYLRKSQCISGANGSNGKSLTIPREGEGFWRTRSSDDCRLTMNAMERYAIECLAEQGVKFNP